jgi:transglutaminase-like putative cysteine protease
VELGFRSDGTAPVYLRGGAYGDGADASQSYITNVTLDGTTKLYEYAFNGAEFNFPLDPPGSTSGFLSGQHTLAFDWIVSSSYVKLMTHICQHGVPWNDVQITYLSNLHTRDYSDAWKTGVASNSSQPAVVRRDSSFMVVGRRTTWPGGDATFEIKQGTEIQTTWPAPVRRADYNARDGHFQHWEVKVPPDAKIGNYTLRMSANGTDLASPVPFRVIFNPYRQVSSTFTKQHLETYAYDEDEDGGDWGADSDHLRDDWTSYHLYPKDNRTYQLHAFAKRDNEPSVLDLALGAAEGQNNEFDAAARLLRLVNQRLFWQDGWSGDNVDDLLGINQEWWKPATALAPSDAANFSRNGTDLKTADPNKEVEGECMDYAATMIALARSVGIPAKHVASPAAFGWGGFHAWSEIYLPSSLLPKQEGKISASGGADSDQDNWYVFDATDNAAAYLNFWGQSEESIDPRTDFWASFADNGASMVTATHPTTSIYTSRLDWDPTCSPPNCANDQAQDIVTDYSRDNDFWITGSSVSSWLSSGDKDIFKLNLSSPKTVSISVLPPFASSDLSIVFCAYDFLTPGTNHWFGDCGNAASSRTLGAGPWTIQVFSNSPHDGVHDGNYVHYKVNVQ